MPRGKQSKGNCAYCGEEKTKGSMTKHFATCPKRQALITKAELAEGTRETLIHLRIEDAWRKEFWLDLEMRNSATLKDLDEYLRAIWLECCGHLSQFSIGGWGGQEIAKRRTIGEVLKLGTELTHIYDFGTSSETLITAVEQRQGKATSQRPIALMARNLPPETPCLECKKPAAWLCMECLIEDEAWGTFCDAHAKTHPHDNYGEPIPLVNSPRLGICGYSGPAEPPY